MSGVLDQLWPTELHMNACEVEHLYFLKHCEGKAFPGLLRKGYCFQRSKGRFTYSWKRLNLGLCGLKKEQFKGYQLCLCAEKWAPLFPAQLCLLSTSVCCSRLWPVYLQAIFCRRRRKNKPNQSSELCLSARGVICVLLPALVVWLTLPLFRPENTAERKPVLNSQVINPFTLTSDRLT